MERPVELARDALARRKASEAHVPMAFVNGLNLHYEVRGQGEPLLLIPGLSTDITAYRGVIDGLAPRLQVIAFDPRGAGRSDKLAEPAGPEGARARRLDGWAHRHGARAEAPAGRA